MKILPPSPQPSPHGGREEYLVSSFVQWSNAQSQVLMNQGFSQVAGNFLPDNIAQIPLRKEGL